MWIVFIVFGVIAFLGLSVLTGAPYVPSHRRDVRQLFRDLGIGSDDVVLDIGSGDGIVLREASRCGATAIGYEIHPFFVVLSRLISRRDSKVSIILTDAWKAPFPDTVTLVYIFSVGRDGRRVVRKMEHEARRLGRTLDIVCYGNPLPKQEAVRQYGAYYRYRFQPLHSS